MNQVPPKPKNFLSIQTLRGIAALIVVLFHASTASETELKSKFFAGIFNFGSAGVDMFFVLSGFIITYTNLKDTNNRRNVFFFLRRRLIRIFPTYWIIISGFLIMQMFLYKTSYQLDPVNLVSTYLLFPGHTMINGVSWSLTNELFFYALFAIAFIFPQKKILFALMILYVIFVSGYYIAGNNGSLGNNWLDLLIFPLNAEFFLGVIAALIFTRMPARLSSLSIFVGVMLFIASAVIEFHGSMIFLNGFDRVVYYGIPSFFIVIGVVRLELVKAIKPHWVLTSLGDASYSLYLIHLPILLVFTRLLSRYHIDNNLIHFILLLAIAVICAISIAFFKYIEKPLIKKLNLARTNLKFI
jgi:peptidoglycan/LPS O-acetylase OafA/YrhL